MYKCSKDQFVLKINEGHFKMNKQHFLTGGIIMDSAGLETYCQPNPLFFTYVPQY